MPGVRTRLRSVRTRDVAQRQDPLRTIHTTARLPVVLGLMWKEPSDPPAEPLGADERSSLTCDAVNVLRDATTTFRAAGLVRTGSGNDEWPPEPSWSTTRRSPARSDLAA